MSAADRLRVVLFASAIAMGVGSASIARAQTEASGAAQALFDEARRLVADGRSADACPKFAESQRLDPASGTLMHLGDCYLKTGRIASAWAAFGDAASVASAEGKVERAQTARGVATALEPKVSRLTIRVPDESDAPSLVVQCDGVAVGRAAWGVAMPIDAGAHIVEASAPGRRSRAASVTVGEDAAQVDFAVAPLELEPIANVAPAAPAADTKRSPIAATPDGSPLLVKMAFVAAGVGIAGLGVGTGFGLEARAKWADAERRCPSAICAGPPRPGGARPPPPKPR
jgi:hypothetical protein